MARAVHTVTRQENAMTGSPKRSALCSILIHAAVIALVLLGTAGKHPPVEHMFLAARDTIVLPLLAIPGRSGGGGGQHDPAPASRGLLPPQARRVFVPPVNRIVNTDPALPMPPAILGQADDRRPTVNLAVLGVPNGAVGPVSGGTGGPYGIGDGIGSGVGNHNGPGYGEEDGPGISGSGRIAGVLTRPVLLWSTEPLYSEEARKAKVQGTVVLYIEIDAHGEVRDVSVRRSMGLGLDDRAMEAVRRWRFKPAMRNGKPVPSGALVEVNFRLL
jgi:protein TonB